MYVVDAEGSLFLARFERISRERAPDGALRSAVVVSMGRYDGERVERQLIFADADLDTGERTPVSEALSKLQPGQPVALRMRNYVSGRTGKGYQMISGVVACEEVESPAQLHAVG